MGQVTVPPKLQHSSSFLCYYEQRVTKTQGMGEQVADKIITGYSTLTHRQYGKYFKDWMVFAHENNFDYMQPLAIHVINFISQISGQCQDKVAAALSLVDQIKQDLHKG